MIRNGQACSARPMRFLLVPALLLAAGGCRHHRQAMRPVLVAPPPAAVVPEACPPGATCPPPTSPGFSEPGGLIESPPVAPAGAPAPGAIDEPRLLEPTPSATTSPPPVNGPLPSSWNTDRGRPSRAALRARLRPFVGDAAEVVQPPKADRPWRFIVLHHSATPTGGYAQIDQEHRQVKGYTGCGYHFVIGNGTGSPDGKIEVARRWSEQKPGAHCRDARSPSVNEDGIGICLVGDFDGAPPTPRQVEATRVLIAYLRDRYAIPADHVGTHALLAGSPTACPGKHFPVAAVLGTRAFASR